MVDKFKNILNKIQTEKSSVTVFAILKMDEIVDKWLVVFSADWITNENSTETFNYLREIIVSLLTPEEIGSISGLGVYTIDEHLIQLILKTVNVKNGDMYLKDSKINGYKVHEAHIFQSNTENDVVFEKVKQ